MSATRGVAAEGSAVFALGLLALGGAALAAFGAAADPTLGRWASYLVFGLLLFGFAGGAVVTRWRVPEWAAHRQRVIAAGGVVVALAGAHFALTVASQWLGDRFQLRASLWPGVLAVLALCTGVGAWLTRRSLPAQAPAPALRLAGVTLVATLAGLVTWAGFAELRNTQEFVLGFRRAPFAQVLAVILVAAVAVLALDARERGQHQGGAWPVLITLSLLACAALAFRSDNLFIDAGERHWEFFVGAVRAVRDGGLLLWDAPSQYGFLNILLAAALPAVTSWQAVYLLQSILLTLVAGVTCLTLVSLLPRNAASWLLATGVALLLFFADPRLIGPQPYPSSSVLRFSPTYFMAAYFLLLSTQRQRWYRRGTHLVGHLLWLLGVFWAAESAIYVSVVYAAGTFCWFACMRGDGDAAQWRRKLRGFVGDGALALGTALGVLILFYAVKLGRLPDFAAFFVYGFSYAGGFGALPIAGYGAHWSLVLPILLLVAQAVVLHGREPGHPGIIRAGVAAAALWAVLSYYVGRATVDNLTALLPLTLFLLVGALADMPRAPTPLLRAALVVFTVNALVLVFTSVSLQTEAARIVSRYRGPVADAAQRLPAAGPELQSLLQGAGVDARHPVAMHGYQWSPPPLRQGDRLLPFEATWLPTPMAMLEQPIAARRRAEVVARFMARKRVEGYVVQERGEYEDRLQDWIGLLAPTHTARLVGETKRWRLYRFTPVAPLQPAARRATGADPHLPQQDTVLHALLR